MRGPTFILQRHTGLTELVVRNEITRLILILTSYVKGQIQCRRPIQLGSLMAIDVPALVMNFIF